MTTTISTQHELGYATEAVLKALREPDFHHDKVRHVGGPGSGLTHFDLDPDGGRLVVITRQRIARDDLPGIARRFASDPIFADRREEWSLSDTWSSAEFTVDVPDAPMRSGGRLSLIGDGDDACHLRTRTFITVRAPLMARSIERGMSDRVREWLEDEQDFTLRWLAEHG